MGAFFGFVFLGLSLAAPIGPVNAAQLDKGIKLGFFHAWLVGLGAILADALYMIAIYFGLVQLLEFPLIKSFLWCFGFFVLVYSGIESIASANKTNIRSKRGDDNHIKSFFLGFVMSLSNPLSIMFWLGIYGSILAKTVAENDQSYVLLYSMALFLGLLIWDVTMAGIASSFKKILTSHALRIISIISGVSLIGFGIYFGIQAAKVLFQ